MPTYAAHAARTPRFWTDFGKWRDQEAIEVRPRFFLTTLPDGLVMMIALPLFEGIEYFERIGWIRAL